MKVHHAIRHSVDFLILICLIGLGLGGLLYFRFDLVSQLVIVILLAISYVFWGIYHHYHDRNLTDKIILEYIAMAFLAAFILIIFLLRV